MVVYVMCDIVAVDIVFGYILETCVVGSVCYV